MKKGVFLFIFFISSSFANDKFILGNEIKDPLKIKFNKNSYLKFNIRLQGTFEKNRVIDKSTNILKKEDENGYLRRARLNITLKLNDNLFFSGDLRNDKFNYKHKYKKGLNIGTSFFNIKRPFNTNLINFKILRAKLDVSRSETVKSAWLVFYHRAYTADEAAQFVSYNRFAENIQIYGNWKYKVKYQLAIGKGISSKKFKDVVGNTLNKIGYLSDRGIAYGGKLIFSPFNSWEEKLRSETYLGKGKHLEFGIGYWKLNNLKFKDNAGFYSMNRTLINYEFSIHYKWFFLESEYFYFDGIEKNFKDNLREIGKGNGWYITTEIVLPEFYYIAPFIRYEKWTKWKNSIDKNDYRLNSKVLGLNWYLKGNNLKIGFVYQLDDYGKNIGNKKIKSFKFVSQIYF